MNVSIDDVIVFDSRNALKKIKCSNSQIWALGSASHLG